MEKIRSVKNREPVFTQEKLLANARRIQGIA
jgi:hypothetical protein